MAKSKGMDGSEGMSPRKAIASGKSDGGGNFGVGSLEDMRHPDGKHPDEGMSHNPLEDHERGIGHGIHYDANNHAAQAAPRHGPHHVEGYGQRASHKHGRGK